jgi:dextranase
MTEPMLLPTKGTYRPDEPVQIETRGSADGELVLLHLGTEVSRVPATGGALVDLGLLPAGGFGIEWRDRGGAVQARTAVDVRSDPASRLRYGFTVDFTPDRDTAGLVETVRRLHLTGIQFYDWAYRHADLLGGGAEYLDPLGQPIARDTVRRLAAAVQSAGAAALGYAAVYAVGNDEWAHWQHDALLRADGTPYSLGDFLRIVDPAADDWLAHFTADLAVSMTSIGFDGFHLDQYGYPKTARRADGAVVDVATSFARMIAAARTALPSARLVFNQVNDFPVWATGRSPQDAVYIEPWEPQTTLGSLAALVDRAKAAGGARPVVLAAYQHVYDTADAASSDRATALTMATLFSHGATQLLAGEADRILVDPYYVRNHRADPSTMDLLRRWYDFAVEHDELLFESGIVDVTAAYAGPYNDDLDVTYPEAAVSTGCRTGAVWRRITKAGDRLMLHLINLTGQEDELWDAPRQPFGDTGDGALRIRPVAGAVPRVRVADPDGAPRLVDVPVHLGADVATATLPPLAAWQLVVVDLVPEQES